ncbi:hypothetical protein [Thermomonas brevis]
MRPRPAPGSTTVVRRRSGRVQVLVCDSVAASFAACTVRALCMPPVSSSHCCSITQASWPSTRSRLTSLVASIARLTPLPAAPCM